MYLRLIFLKQFFNLVVLLVFEIFRECYIDDHIVDASKMQKPKKDSESSTREELEEEKQRLREVCDSYYRSVAMDECKRHNLYLRMQFS